MNYATYTGQVPPDVAAGVPEILELLRRHPGSRVVVSRRSPGSPSHVTIEPGPPTTRPPARRSKAPAPAPTSASAPAQRGIGYVEVARDGVLFDLRRQCEAWLPRLAARQGLRPSQVKLAWFRKARPGERPDWNESQPVVGVSWPGLKMVALRTDLHPRTAVEVLEHELCHLAGGGEVDARRRERELWASLGRLS